MEDKNEYYTVKQAAEALQVSVRVIRKLILEKNLPIVNLKERLTRIPRKALEEWVDKQINNEQK